MKINKPKIIYLSLIMVLLLFVLYIFNSDNIIRDAVNDFAEGFHDSIQDTKNR
jgi:hypothetical protein